VGVGDGSGKVAVAEAALGEGVGATVGDSMAVD